MVVDLAHNEAGLEALLDVARVCARPAAGCTWRSARRATAPTTSSRRWARSPACAPTTSSRPTRTTTCAAERRRTSRPSCGSGWPGPGVADIASLPDRARRAPGAASRRPRTATSRRSCATPSERVVAWLRARGAASDDPDAIRRKVVRARGEHEAEDEITALWGCRTRRRASSGPRSSTPRTPATRASPRVRGHARQHRPRGAGGAAVRAGAGGRAARAAPPPGPGPARLQPAQPRPFDEAVAVDRRRRARHPESLGVAAFRRLVQHDAGDAVEALRRPARPVVATSTDPTSCATGGRSRRTRPSSGELRLRTDRRPAGPVRGRGPRCRRTPWPPP